MLSQILLGIAGGLFFTRLFSQRRHEAAFAEGMPMGLAGFHPGRLLEIAHELHLDAMQREQVKDILRAMQRFGMDTRWHQGERLEAIARAMKGDRFARAEVEAIVDGQLEREAAARRDILDRIELFHNGLTSEQRDELHRHLGDLGETEAATT